MIKECPECGEALTTKKRNSDDELFVACTGFPDCRYTRDMEDEDWDDVDDF